MSAPPYVRISLHRERFLYWLAAAERAEFVSSSQSAERALSQAAEHGAILSALYFLEERPGDDTK